MAPRPSLLNVIPREDASSVRHRLRAILPETLRDTEVQEDPLLDQTILKQSNNNTETHTWHSPQPALQHVLTKGIPTEAVVLLNVVAVIWGSQHPIIKMVVEDCDAAAFSLVRFCLAATIATLFSPPPLPVRTRQQDTDDSIKSAQVTWRWGAEMGLWMFLGYAFQAIGLEFTTAQRSGFLLYLNVKFVPFFAKILFGRDISIPTWISAFVAVLGTALLSWEGKSLDFNIGDVWSIAAAATSAMFILRLEAAASQVSDSGALNATCLWVVTIASFLWTLGQGIMDTSISTIETIPNIWDNVLHTIKSHPLELVYLSGVTTALANYIQTRAQKNVSAERASVIYAMDPVYGAMFSFWLLGERLTNFGMAGAGLITIAAATNALLDLGKPLASEEGEFQVVNGGLKEETNGTMSHGSDEQSSR